MCYYITIGIPEGASVRLSQVAGLELPTWRGDNKYIEAHLPDGYQCYVLTASHCSCDLYTSPIEDEQLVDTVKKLTTKYRKKG